MRVSIRLAHVERAVIEKAQARLRAAGLDITWGPLDGRPSRYEIEGALTLYDSPETVALKFSRARLALEQAIQHLEYP